MVKKLATVAAVGLVLAGAAQAATPAPRVAQRMADRYSGHDVQVYCSRMPEGVWGYTGPYTTEIHIDPFLCRELRKRQPAPIAVVVVIHEAMHQRHGGDEIVAECLAQRLLPDALWRFYGFRGARVQTYRDVAAEESYCPYGVWES